MAGSPLLERLIDALRCLPGVGPKSVQRMAYHLLQRDRAGARHLALALNEAMDKIGHCRPCRTLTELEVCSICASDRRDSGLLCVSARWPGRTVFGPRASPTACPSAESWNT